MNLLDNCYISFVNLDHRKDRLERMKKVLAQAGIPAVRTRGMLPSEYAGDPERVKVMRMRTPGAIGCHFSQVRIMEEALNRRKHAFVMEDDLLFCSDFQERLAHMEQFVSGRDWDILWLGGTFHINPPYWDMKRAKRQDKMLSAPVGRDAELTDDPRMIKTYAAFCTYAYIVRDISILKVLTGLDRVLDRSMGIDWAMIECQPEWNTFAYVPGCCRQIDNQSDIGKGMTIFSGFAKLGPYWFQDNKAQFDPTQFNWHEAKV